MHTNYCSAAMIETETNLAEATATEKIQSTGTTPGSKPKSDTTSSNSGRESSSSFLVAQGFALLISTIIIGSFWEFEDASRALAFYGVYHRYGWNQVIHFFGVPGIVWSLMIFLVYIPLPFVNNNDGDNSSNTASDGSSPQRQDKRPLNYAAFLGISYTIFYLSIDPLGATLYAPVMYAMYASAVAIADRERAAAAKPGTELPWYGTGGALRFALAVHVFCWYAQIHLGHKIIEGAQPAVLQSLGGALSVAPLFAFYEGLWMLGINKGLQESTALLVDEYTLELCAEKGVTAMKACLSL